MVLLRNVLVATDFSEASEAALAYGRELAWTFGSRLHVLHAIEQAPIPPATENWCTLSPFDLRGRQDAPRSSPSLQANAGARRCQSHPSAPRIGARTARPAARPGADYCAPPPSGEWRTAVSRAMASGAVSQRPVQCLATSHRTNHRTRRRRSLTVKSERRRVCCMFIDPAPPGRPGRLLKMQPDSESESGCSKGPP
jgi:nucleotide-binding universal stress UspA family protein